jgi:hypothetical protein
VVVHPPAEDDDSDSDIVPLRGRTRTWPLGAPPMRSTMDGALVGWDANADDAMDGRDARIVVVVVVVHEDDDRIRNAGRQE